MKRLRHLLWGLLAFSCTTTDLEPTLSVAQPDRDTPSVKYLSPKEAGNIATAFMASLDGDGERSRGDKCLTSLAKNNPVYMRGKSSNRGHAWVVDGYNEYSSRTEYYNKETGELSMVFFSPGYTYLHFNSGQFNQEGDAYYMCAGVNGIYADDYKNFSTFGFTENNQIITGITR